MIRLPCMLLALIPFVPFVRGQAGNDVGTPVGTPVIRWQFDGAGEPGPRPPAYPAFAPTNTAYTVAGPRAALTIRERDVKGNLRFTQGESITLEAWVRVGALRDGSHAYVIGKGRTGKARFPEKNHNYALRLSGAKGEACVSFLFASAPADGKPGDWHRWTSSTGFTPGGWHHVAVSYTFGKPGSIRGYIDGRPVPGKWDMGGATTRLPVVDADDLVIGSGNGYSAGNTLNGSVDEVAIWRTALPADTIAGRYEFVPPPPVVRREELPKGEVLIHLCEAGLPGRNAWPDLPPAPTETYRERAFGFFAIPHKYVDTGVRADRANPLLFRAAAVVSLPAGKHRLLLRGRGASRLYIDGKLVLSTPFPPADSSGHGTVADPSSYLNLGPDFRFAPPGNQETWAPFTAPGGEHLVVLETLVGMHLGGGAGRRRPELGETVVALSPHGSESWQLVSPAGSIPYTDAGWAAYEAGRSAHFDRVNAAARAAKRQEHAAYWARRREAAKAWLARTPEVPVPTLPKGFPAHNPIDHFLAVTMARARAENAGAEKRTVDYFKHVRPILEARCYDCHTGDKAKGGLRLDRVASVIRGGTSDGSAIVPGRPDASALFTRVRSADDTEVMPPKGSRLTKEQVQTLETWIREGAHWPALNGEHTALTPLTGDLAFLRRVTLDTVGVVPTPDEVRRFLADPPDDRRTRAIDRLLADPRWADHQMGYWQDLLAENPNIINPTLNNTGPFRWWLYESFRDNKPFDLFATELLRMRGSERYGGPAGFGIASQNDVPMAAKGTVVAGAFLGVQMKCARCHDAPAHRSTQRDLFQLAALLAKKPLTVPATSSVPLDKVHQDGRKPLIQVTLRPGTAVEPGWPFADLVPESIGHERAEDPTDPRDRVAALVTAPENERFARVAVNRVWQRLMGRGLVEPVDDWEKGGTVQPELLRWLGRELVRSGYDLKHVTRLVLSSHAYQRATDESLREPDTLFAAPAPRRLTAEQVVDSLFAATGKPWGLEEVSLDIDGRREQGSSIGLGKPRRAWMLASTSNERDRPSLSLPRIQMVCDVLSAFGWRASRQDPTSARDQDPNALQPAILANGAVTTWLTRLSDDHGLTGLALKEQSVAELVDALFLRMLTRRPTPAERAEYVAYLKDGFAGRVRSVTPAPAVKRQPVPYVSWSNHLHPRANVIRLEQEAAARRGDPPTDRLEPTWRARMEDVVWALVNAPEFVFVP